MNGFFRLARDGGEEGEGDQISFSHNKVLVKKKNPLKLLPQQKDNRPFNIDRKRALNKGLI